MKKPKMGTFGVNVRLNVEIGFDVKAESLVAAIQQVQALTITDIVDFKANGWEHNSSEDPVVLSAWAHP